MIRIVGSLMLFIGIILGVMGGSASNLSTGLLLLGWAFGLFIIGIILLIVGFFIKRRKSR